jgi:hypothetical protein
MTDSDETDTGAVRRTLNKQEAIRHLLHTAIRMIVKMEDPFAIHMLVQSADKLLNDMARKQNKILRVHWEDYIKEEYKTPFFKRHRAIYNYFKHADEDFADDLPVHDIMMMNLMQLFVATANYVALFGATTYHMAFFQIFIVNVSPHLVTKDAPMHDELMKNIRMTQTMTPAEFFRMFEENPSALPNYLSEIATDLQDITDFYHVSFAGLRAGETKSHRIIRRLPA